ncbi:MAG: cystathionine beta-lyase [Nitriliruptoraceae bacterium]|jgi:cystathionine beta-lyase
MGVDMMTSPFGSDPDTLERVFGRRDGLLPLWVAEPSLPLAAPIVEAITQRAATGWYGYEARPQALYDAFTTWVSDRHGWDVTPLRRAVSPSVATSIGVLLEHLCAPGDGVVLQPPVFTDFKPLVTAAGTRLVRNALVLGEDGYAMDLEQLTEVTRPADVRALILCNPHNPVGRVWRVDELRGLAEVCAANGVAVLADELHADLVLSGHTFVPFAVAAQGTGVRWAAMHGPLKTFGLAGMSDTLLLTDDDDLRDAFARRSNQLHLTRNHVMQLPAMQAGYEHGSEWLDGLLTDTARRAQLLADGFPDGVTLLPLEGTYLGWLDLRGLGMEVPELTRWLVDDAGLALSMGHWFGREGAGFARITLAVEDEFVAEAARRLAEAAARR